MSRTATLPDSLRFALAAKEPLLWLNDAWQPIKAARDSSSLTLAHVQEAESRWNRFSRLLMKLFPELGASHGVIDSPLVPADELQKLMTVQDRPHGRWLIKADHALPVAGSIKARGGIYEVLWHAEGLALRHGLLRAQEDPVVLAEPEARRFFSQYQVAVGSTGNLGLSIGIMSAALGFKATVHMSSDAKEWKKQRLRDRGVEVVDHQGDFGAAVAAGRALADQDPMAYFIDDEHSEHLFLGYSVAALHLERQLTTLRIPVDASHPLFVYLPCGVGGAPGGITFGLRQLLADRVHCFFAEPVASPCMLIRLASIDDRPISVRDIGLDNCTEADGLAVGQASEFVAPFIRSLVSGVFTVRDSDLFKDLYQLDRSESLRIEPSAAAGFRGPQWLLQSEQGRRYLRGHDLLDTFDQATHVLWTTGGSLVPADEYSKFLERGRLEATRSPN